MYRVYILLGSNLGDREQYLSDAVMELMDRLMPDYLEVASLAEAVNTSEVIESEPIGFSCPDKFLNQTFCCLTEYEPHQVLEICQEIETELGRVRTGAQYNEKGERIYQSRCIDIDILNLRFKRLFHLCSLSNERKITDVVELRDILEKCMNTYKREYINYLKP